MLLMINKDLALLFILLIHIDQFQSQIYKLINQYYKLFHYHLQ